MAETVVGSLAYIFKGDVSNLTESLKAANAQISTFNDNLKSSTKEASKGFDDIADQIKGVTETVKSASGLMELAFRGIAAGALAGLSAVIKNTIDQLNDVKNIVSKSDAAGISSNLFQTWTQQAKDLRISTEDAEKAILHAGDALKGQFNPISANQSGSLAKSASFVSSADGMSAGRDALEQARTLDQMHQAALLVVKDYEDAAQAARDQGLELLSIQRELEAVRVATSVWGEAGKDVANAIKDGTLNVEEFGRKGNEAAKWPQDIIEGQRKANDELTTAYNKLKDELEPHYEALVRLVIEMQSAWAGVVTKIAEAIKGAKELFASSWDWLRSWKDEAPISGAGAQGRSMRQLENDLNFRGGQPEGPEAPAPYQTANVPAPPTRPDYIEPLKKTAGGSKSASHKEAEDSVQRYIDHLSKAAESAQAETANWALGNVERTKAVKLAEAEEIARQQGRSLSEGERQIIAEKAELLAKSKDQTDNLRMAQQRLNDAMREFANVAVSAFDSIVMKGQKAVDVLRQIVSQLASSALKGLLTGEGMFGRLFGMEGTKEGGLGGLFGKALALMPKFAEGGTLGAGKWGIAGEAGPELIKGPAQVVPFSKMGGGGNVTIHNYAGADVQASQNSNGEWVVIVQKMIEANNAKVPGILASSQRRSM